MKFRLIEHQDGGLLQVLLSLLSICTVEYLIHVNEAKKESASQEMVVAVRVLLAALLGLYWSSSRVEGNQRELNVANCIFLLHHSNVYQKPEGWKFELC